jgi:chromosome segregation ATPase
MYEASDRTEYAEEILTLKEKLETQRKKTMLVKAKRECEREGRQAAEAKLEMVENKLEKIVKEATTLRVKCSHQSKELDHLSKKNRDLTRLIQLG